MIIDNFLPEFEELQRFALTAEFTDIVSPFDGVTYPLICADIPERFTDAVFNAIAKHCWQPKSPTIFMRRSPAGVHAPQQVHSDLSMGRMSLQLYLNREEDCKGGTSFLSHRATGIAYNPGMHQFSDIVVADQNMREAWDIREMANMKPNRAVIFDAARLHRAEPVGGFGDSPQNTRVVLTCFFN